MFDLYQMIFNRLWINSGKEGFMNSMLGLCVLLIFCSCERPGFIKKVRPAEVVSKSYTVQEFVGNRAEIVWVIDNSGSMRSYQEAVIQNMQIFIDSFVQSTRGSDWRMALLSTEKSELPYIGFSPYSYLESSDINPVARFNSAVKKLGINGSGPEESFYPIQMALTVYKDFLREGSKLFIIVVSDEREQGDMSVDDFLQFLYTLRDPEDIATYGVLGMKEQKCGIDNYFGGRYHEFIKKTNGLMFSICSSDYGEGLARFASDIARRTSVSKIQLRESPIVDTIEILYRGKKLPKGRDAEGGTWNYNSVDNSIHFHNLDFLAGFDLERVRVNFEKARLPEE